MDLQRQPWVLLRRPSAGVRNWDRAVSQHARCRWVMNDTCGCLTSLLMEQALHNTHDQTTNVSTFCSIYIMEEVLGRHVARLDAS